MRLNLLLTLAVLATALYLVHVQYESRRLYVELEKAAAQARKLEVAHESLQAQKRGEATPLRVNVQGDVAGRSARQCYVGVGPLPPPGGYLVGIGGCALVAIVNQRLFALWRAGENLACVACIGRRRSLHF